jgi:hypothetical protein
VSLPGITLHHGKVLTCYSPTRLTRIVVDASRLKGLGFVLKKLQFDGAWRPVHAGSRFLTSAETQYAMIELKMLAIAWAFQKTWIFIEGLSRKLFELWTDHAPLVLILEKQALPDIANKQLQRLKMKVDHLTFKTVWIKDKDNVKADALSCHRELRDFCNEDANYKMITEHVAKGFPKDAINIPDILMPYSR